MHKLNILKKYLNKKPFSVEDLKWMDEHDWHPIDERELKKSLAVELEKTRKGSFKRVRA